MTSSAAADRSSCPSRSATTICPLPAPGFEPVRVVGDIEEHRLAANGLRVLYMEWRAAPVALLMLTYDVGSRHEPAHARGASHMLEHLMFKGSAGFNAEAGSSMFNPPTSREHRRVWVSKGRAHLELATPAV